MRIVLTSWGSFGDVYPYIGLAKALKDLGHEPVMAAPAYYRNAIEQESIAFAAMSPDVDPADRATMARIMDPARGTEVVLRELLLPSLEQSFDDIRRIARGADLLVSHPITLATPIAAETMKIPWISTVLAPLSFFSTTDLPVFPPAPRLVHLRRLGPWVGRLFVGAAHRATASWMEPVYRLRAGQGLPRGEHPLFAGQFSPTMTLALFSKVLGAPQPDWPANVQVPGFVFYNGPAGSLDPALEAFLQSGEPPIVFTLGTSAVGAAGSFYEESIKAVANLGRRAVLLTGGYRENESASPLPPGVTVVDRAPHQLLFPRARAIVHQGGIGTTAQALRSGRPMIVVPHGHDQPDNAFRVTNLGVARTLFPKQYRAARVARELTALDGERYRSKASEVAEVVKREGGAPAAAGAIDRLLAR